jgi:hypothetical protein
MNALSRAVRRALLAIAALAAILSLTLLLFLSQPVVHVILDASSAPAVLGVEPTVAHDVSDQLVRDLLFNGSFDAKLGGSVFLSSAERSHLVDVGGLFRNVLMLGILGLISLCGLAARRRRLVIRSIGDGALLLGAGATMIGGAFVFAFDATFTAAHELLFPTGTWTFNPASDHLVQLYPEAFWVTAAIGFCVVLVVAASAGFLLSRRFHQ